MKALVLPGTAQGLEIAARALTEGELVAIPTETVYGLAGNAKDERVLADLFDAKERPRFDPLIFHIAAAPGHGVRALEKFANDGFLDPAVLQKKSWLGDASRALVERFWPGPLTLVLPRGPNALDLATSGLPTVAVRAPAHPLAQALLSQVPFPLCAPSANRFGRISPTSASDVAAELGDRIPFILDGGRCAVGVESTIIAIQPDGGARLLRPGGLPVEAIEATLQTKLTSGKNQEGAAVEAPGNLASHYAPRCKLTLLPGLATDSVSVSILAKVNLPYALLLFASDPMNVTDALRQSQSLRLPVRTLVLTERSNPTEAANRLFSCLRDLDSQEGIEGLYAEPVPSRFQLSGLGYAIQDRLSRAATET